MAASGGAASPGSADDRGVTIPAIILALVVGSLSALCAAVDAAMLAVEDDELAADPSLAEKELGWKATRGLDEMAADTWRWQLQNPDGFRD